MCKNVYWHCILCNATIGNSSIPDLCHYATVSGFECLPHEQEQWPIPLYSTCFTCREERRPRRGRRRRHHHGRYYPAPATTSAVVVEEGMPVTQANDDYHLKEGYIWGWIPIPTACSLAAQSVTGSDDWHFLECEIFDGDEQSQVSDATAGSIRAFEEAEEAEKAEKDTWVSNSDSLQVYRPSTSSTIRRSFIPVPVRSRASERARQDNRSMRSNIPVASRRVRREQRQSSIDMDSVFPGGEAEAETESRIVGLNDFDWEHFDSITF